MYYIVVNQSLSFWESFRLILLSVFCIALDSSIAVKRINFEHNKINTYWFMIESEQTHTHSRFESHNKWITATR